MSIFKRIKSIVNANINDMLDKVESPEAMVNQMIREMDAAILEVRQNTASAMASQRMTEKRLRKAEAEADKWQQNAETAVENNDDDLARQALRQKQICKERADILQAQAEDETRLVTKLRTQLRQLEEQVQRARAKRDTLIAKQRATSARKKMMDQANRVQSASAGTVQASEIINGFSAFEQMEDQIDHKMAELDAHEELSRERCTDLDAAQQCRDMRTDSDIESELESLKKNRRQ